MSRNGSSDVEYDCVGHVVPICDSCRGCSRDEKNMECENYIPYNIKDVYVKVEGRVFQTELLFG